MRDESTRRSWTEVCPRGPQPHTRRLDDLPSAPVARYQQRSADAALVRGWIEWLQGMRWDWWATPTFRYPVTPTQAVRAVEAWLAPLPSAYAAIGVQRGPTGDRLHVHALVGGTGRHPVQVWGLRRGWRRGNVRIEGFRPHLGAVAYLVRQADEIELLGSPVPWRPRRRRP